MTRSELPARDAERRSSSRWVVAAFVLTMGSAAGFTLLRDELLAEVAGSPLPGGLLGWVPVGATAWGFAAFLWWRGGRVRRGLDVRRPADRLALVPLLVGAGLAVATFPHRHASWTRTLAPGGADFSFAARGGFLCLGAVAVLTAVLAVVAVVRTSVPADSATLHRVLATGLAAPYVVWLVVAVTH